MMKEIHNFYLIFTVVTVSATHAPPRIVSTIAKTMATIHMARPSSPYTSSSSDTDSIIANVPTGTALRRLYFKTAKTSKMASSAQSVKSSPSGGSKVIVINSSCNSTINTSTESASTHLTNITTTDTETCDSLDLGLFVKLISHEP
jgi:hypothetical protein